MAKVKGKIVKNFVITREKRGNKFYFVARKDGKIYSRIRQKGGLTLDKASRNFNQTRNLKKSAKYANVIREKQVYKSGLVKEGFLVKNGQALPDKPREKGTLQFTYKAIFGMNEEIYGTSFDVNKYGLTENEAKEQAANNLFKNISEMYDPDQYSAEKGISIAQLKRPTIYAGWTIYK